MAYDAADARYKAGPKWWHTPLSLITGSFKANCRAPTPRGEAGDLCCVHNGHLILQGPNYALAKTLQNWRTVVARAGDGAVAWTYTRPLFGST